MKPKRYFGLHMVDGTAEYEEEGKAPYKIFINEKTIRQMGPSFEGCPVYVQHVDEVDLDNIQVEADGYVVKSFYNAADGKHWCEFIVVSDKGHEAISKGWKLSNCYIPTQFGGRGEWNGMSYEKEVLAGEFEHLAIVDNPRYAESKIFTPEQFKSYNDELQSDLRRVANSTNEGERMSKLKFWKRTEVTKVENSADLDGLTVELPKSKKEMTIGQLVQNMDASMMPDQYANGEHKVKVGKEEMTVNDLVKKHMEMCNKMGSGEQGEDAKDEGAEHPADEVNLHENADDEDMENDAGDTDGEGADEDGKEEKAKEDKKKNDLELARAAAAKKKADKAHFDALKNADKIDNEVAEQIDTSEDKVARGRSRYGS